MSGTNLTAEQVSDSINGFDLIAISQQFGRTFTDLAQNDPGMAAYALVFIVKRREGLPDPEAKDAALGMSMKEFESFFAEPSEEEAGKGEGSEEQPASSLSSVS